MPMRPRSISQPRREMLHFFYSPLEDEYFVKRKLYPNVDFYSGIVLRALGIPVNMFTVLFAVARSVGWLAQWNESFGDPSQRICRPRQLYHGTTPREFAPMEAR